MASNRYSFLTRWRVPARIEDAYAVLEDTLSLPRWWPSVFLKVEETGPSTYALLTKGWLPYLLRWQARTLEKVFPTRIRLGASGDFDGGGLWELRQEGGIAAIDYTWEVVADKPLLKWFSWIMKPLFSANHGWAMARGRESLELELRRRRGEKVPLPPGPTFLAEARRKALGLEGRP
ncbi:MAG: polyketide cyclase [Gemmataceae bacterium]|nr:polyketide cyclase [Gemmataceae bacterium]